MNWLKKLLGFREGESPDANPLGLQFLDLRSEDHKRWAREAREGKGLGSRQLDALAGELVRIAETKGFTGPEDSAGFDGQGRNIRAHEIGEILYKKGGIKLMERVSYIVLEAGVSEVSLAACWNGIGTADDYWLG